MERTHGVAEKKRMQMASILPCINNPIRNTGMTTNAAARSEGKDVYSSDFGSSMVAAQIARKRCAAPPISMIFFPLEKRHSALETLVSAILHQRAWAQVVIRVSSYPTLTAAQVTTLFHDILQEDDPPPRCFSSCRHMMSDGLKRHVSRASVGRSRPSPTAA
jgi:hypothetical protein